MPQKSVAKPKRSAPALTKREIVEQNQHLSNQDLLKLLHRSGYTEATIYTINGIQSQLHRHRKTGAGLKTVTVGPPAATVKSAAVPAEPHTSESGGSQAGHGSEKDVVAQARDWYNQRDAYLQDIREERERLQKRLSELDEAERLINGMQQS